jgi:hypothetical protein
MPEINTSVCVTLYRKIKFGRSSYSALYQRADLAALIQQCWLMTEPCRLNLADQNADFSMFSFSLSCLFATGKTGEGCVDYKFCVQVLNTHVCMCVYYSIHVYMYSYVYIYLYCISFYQSIALYADVYCYGKRHIPYMSNIYKEAGKKYILLFLLTYADYNDYNIL